VTDPAAASTASASDFLPLLQQRTRGKLKLYVGSAAGVGKTFRMLQEAHDLRRRGVDVVVGFVEPHSRKDTLAQIGDLEIVPRRTTDYRGVRLEEMDVDAIVARRPGVAIVDELAHTNVPGSPRGKRWEDVVALLDEGINVISALNVQHMESLNDVVAKTLGVTVRETVPDWVVALADQVVNVDISSEDLRTRLEEGKIYPPERVPAALMNFFTPENLATLRELALREVASSVDRAREEIVRREAGAPVKSPTVDRIMVAMSSDVAGTATLLRKASRIAGRLSSDWYCVYVRTPEEHVAKIDSDVQRALVKNIQLAQSMGADVQTVDGDDVVDTLLAFAREHGVSLIVVGQSRGSFWRYIRRGSVVRRLVNNPGGLGVLVVPFEEPEASP
jgi:two-component system, OmpR family, sensor histidine kinase KdpD